MDDDTPSPSQAASAVSSAGVSAAAEDRAVEVMLAALAGCDGIDAALMAFAAGLARVAPVREAWWLDGAGRSARCADVASAHVERWAEDELDPAPAAQLAAARACSEPTSLEVGGETGEKLRWWIAPLYHRRRRIGTLAAVAQGAPHSDAALGRVLARVHAALAAAATRLVALDRLAAETARLAESLSQSSRLAAGVAHEIRNPLVAMGHALREVQSRVQLRQEDQELLQLVVDEAERVNRMMSDFLGLARTTRLARSPVRFETLVRRTLVLAAEDPRLAEVRLEPAVAEGLPEIAADGDRLRQVVWNLLLNAAEAAGPGGCVQLHVRASERGGVRGVRLDVDDDGPGIPAADRLRVFEPFETGRDDGTGLGLPLVRHIVGRHGGAVWIEGAPLGGARVSVWLPTEARDELPAAARG